VAHAVQAEFPVPAAYRPAVQLVQVIAPVEAAYFPAAHAAGAETAPTQF